jgi:hypothetical protein
LGLFRRDYIEVAKQLEPIDAAILQLLYAMSGDHEPSRADWISQRLSAERDQTIVAFQKLHGLNLITSDFLGKSVPDLSPLGRQFLRVLGP